MSGAEGNLKSGASPGSTAMPGQIAASTQRFRS